jgi:hypothetical protein
MSQRLGAWSPRCARRWLGLASLGAVGILGAACGSSGGAQPRPTSIVSFDLGTTFGEVPLDAELVWKLDAETTEGLICELDFEGDGVVDLRLEGCPLEGAARHAYTTGGRFEPSLTVRGADGSVISAKSVVYANQLEPTPRHDRSREAARSAGPRGRRRSRDADFRPRAAPRPDRAGRDALHPDARPRPPRRLGARRRRALPMPTL